MPLPATSNSPGLSRTAPVNAPRTCPKSSDSSSVSVSAAQLIETNGPAGARALVVDQPNDELLAGAALAVDQDRRVQRRDTPRELEHLLHGGAAGDEMLRGGVTGDALAQQVELTLALGDVPLAAFEFLQPLVHGLA